jgi:septal ring factor EnvC (AmiA/AmiB activator)
MIASLLARPAMLAYLAGLLAIGGWGLHQSHQLGRAEMAREMAVTQRDQWQAEAEKVQLELAQTRVVIRTYQTAVESIRQEAANRARAAKEARERAEALARERDAAVTRWRASAGASCVEAMPMVREALGL